MSHQEDLSLEKMNCENGSIDMTIGGEASMRFMRSLIQFFETNGGENYLTLDIEGIDKRYSITIEDTTKKIGSAEKLSEIQDALSDMVFAYINKDTDLPHDFEIHALKKAGALLPENKFIPAATKNAIEKLGFDPA